MIWLVEMCFFTAESGLTICRLQRWLEMILARFELAFKLNFEALLILLPFAAAFWLILVQIVRLILRLFVSKSLLILVEGLAS